jgi:hypothetical protein
MECGCGLHSTGSGQDPATASCEHGMNLRIPQKASNLLTSRMSIRFSRRIFLYGVGYFLHSIFGLQLIGMQDKLLRAWECTAIHNKLKVLQGS